METVVVAIAALACPIGMGLMMWFMAKGMRKDSSSQEAATEAGGIDALRDEHHRLGAEIERLEGRPSEDGAGCPKSSPESPRLSLGSHP